MKAIDPRNISG